KSAVLRKTAGDKAAAGAGRGVIAGGRFTRTEEFAGENFLARHAATRGHRAGIAGVSVIAAFRRAGHGPGCGVQCVVNRSGEEAARRRLHDSDEPPWRIGNSAAGYARDSP